MAVRIPQPDNVDEAHAVPVVLVEQGDRRRSSMVDYLSRADATAYRPVIDRLAAAGHVAACRASISGGWQRGDDRGRFGARLFLESPQNHSRTR